MKIWLLKAKDRSGLTPRSARAILAGLEEWNMPAHYYEGFTIRAASSRGARELASDRASDIRWKDREWASCELVRLEMKPAVLLASFKAG